MSPRKLIFLTALVLILFGFIFFFERKMPTTSERKAKGELHWDLPADKVVSIRLDRRDSTVELARAGADNWRLVKPELYPADSFAAGELSRDLAQLKRVGGDSSEARPEDYGLKSPEAKATLVWTDPKNPSKKETRTLELGIEIPGTDATAARVAGQSAVLFVPTSLATSIKKPAADFKSKDVFTGASSEASRIDVERGRGHLVLARKDGVWWLEQPLTDLADADAASRLNSDLTALRVVDFLAADREALATYGLAPPLYRVSLSDAKNARITVDFGATRSDGNSVYGRREGQVFTVPSTGIEELSKEAEGFREPHLLRFERAGVKAVEGHFSQASFALTRRADGGWNAGGKPVLAATGEDLLTAIVDLKSRAFLDEADAGGLAGRPPDAEVTVTPATGLPWKISFYSAAGDVSATVTRRPGGFRMPSDTLTSLRAAFEKALRQPTPRK